MADEDDIKRLRRLINEQADESPYSTAELGAALDAAGGDVTRLARDIWVEKAAGYSELVDVQEGSSRRSLGDLHEQALSMAANLSASLDALPDNRRRPRTRAIERP